MSSIKLTADSGGGTFEIKAPASSGNTRVLTLPDTGNYILGGRILQVVSTTKTDTFSSSTTNSFVDITGMSATITPKSPSSKILLHYDLNMSGSELFFIQLVRGSTAIKVGDSDSANRVECTQGGVLQAINADKVAIMAGSFLDSPSTTSATTYKIQGRVYAGGSQSFTVNKSNADSNALYAGRGASTITLMEVAG
tara:strand:- start:199 stop:786 length:588 start_codon:yes stop_codon:yes gene_type:complete